MYRQLPLMVILMVAASAACPVQAAGVQDTSITPATAQLVMGGDTEVSNEMTYAGTMPEDGHVKADTVLFTGFMEGNNGHDKKAVRFTPGVMDDITTGDNGVQTATARSQTPPTDGGGTDTALPVTLRLTGPSARLARADTAGGWLVSGGAETHLAYAVVTTGDEDVAPGDYIISVDAADWVG